MLASHVYTKDKTWSESPERSWSLVSLVAALSFMFQRHSYICISRHRAEHHVCDHQQTHRGWAYTFHHLLMADAQTAVGVWICEHRTESRPAVLPHGPLDRFHSRLTKASLISLRTSLENSNFIGSHAVYCWDSHMSVCSLTAGRCSRLTHTASTWFSSYFSSSSLREWHIIKRQHAAY